MPRKGLWLFGIVGVLALGQMALAAPENMGPWKFSIGIDERYTDNRDGLKSDKESDFDTIVNPRVDAVFKLDQTDIDFFYAPSLLNRSNPRSDQARFNFYQSLGLDAAHRFSDRFKAYAGEYLDYTDDPRVDQGNTTVRENASYWMNRTKAGIGFAVDPRVMLDAGGHYDVKRYTDSTFKTSNEDRWGADADMKFAAGRNTTLSVLGDYSDVKYVDARQGAYFVMGGAGFEETFSPSLYANLVAGYQNAVPKDGMIDSKSSPTVRGEIVISASPSTRLRLKAAYDLAPPEYQPFALQEQTTVSARIERDLTKRVGFAIQGLYADGHYSRDFMSSNSPADTPVGDDTLVDGMISVTYQLSHTFSLGLNYEYEDWTSDIRDSFTRNTVDLSLRAQL